MAFNLADLIEHTVDAVPDRTALVCGDRQETYAELEERANRLAHHLAAQGVGERDHVAIYSYNSLEFVEAMLAAYKLRAVPINVNYRYVEDELVYLFDNADPVALVYQAEFSPAHRRGAGPAAAAAAPRRRSTTAVGHAERRRRGRLRGGAGRRRRPSATSARATRRRPLHPLHRRHDRLPEGRGVAARGRVAHPRRRHRLRHRRAHRGRVPAVAATPRRPSRAPRLVLAPLMHGAAQWGTLGGLIKGTTTVLLPQVRPARACGRRSAKYGITTIAITGDAMARPLIDALRERDLRHLVARRARPRPPRCSRRS